MEPAVLSAGSLFCKDEFSQKGIDFSGSTVYNNIYAVLSESGVYTDRTQYF